MKLLQLLSPTTGDLKQVDTVALGPKLNLGSPGTALTITSTTITITQSWHQVTASGNQTARTIRTINGGVEGDILLLSKDPTSPGDVIVDDNSGNIQCAGNFTLTNLADKIGFIYHGTQWCELFRANNA